MKKVLGLCVSAITVLGFVSCRNSTESGNNPSQGRDTTALPKSTVALRENVLTSSDQAKLTPDVVLQDLKEGNKRYVSKTLTANDYIGMLHSSSTGQFPEAFVLSCIDSRVPVETVFDKGIGDLFVGRVAGNIADEDILGSIEYGCKVSGAKLIVVLGHESCGAIKAAIEDERMGNITAMLAKLKPVLAKSKDFRGEQTVGNHDFVDYVVKNNVKSVIETIQKKSPILKEMIDKGQVKIAGAYYSFEDGSVSFLY